MSALGKYIRSLRKERKLRLADVGRAVNRSAAFICDLEKGVRGKRPNPEMLIQLAEYFQVPATMMLQKGGLVTNPDNQNFQLYLKATRNKVKSALINERFSTLFELLMELESATLNTPPLRKLVDSTITTVRELQQALQFGH
jgi:transcriptional regulator with XRE-family HTH domain